jgi:succinate dehydrogenase / fumarate reductase membrane anchor subunit
VVRTEDHAGRRRGGRSFESKSWLFMRASGVALVVLSLLHFAITHITNDVTETGYAFVAQRWDNPLWRAFDWTLLALALLHGLNGVRWIVDDYVRNPRARALTFGVIAGLSGVLFAAGTLTILTF